jgi:hypothetical protein
MEHFAEQTVVPILAFLSPDDVSFFTGISLERALFWFGLALILIGVMGQFYDINIARPVAGIVIGCILVGGSVAYATWAASRPTQQSGEDDYQNRQVKGNIRTIFTSSGGAMAVALTVDEGYLPERQAARRTYEANHGGKKFNDTYIGSQNINPNVRDLLMAAYDKRQPVLVTINGLTPDGIWYVLQDAYIGQF